MLPKMEVDKKINFNKEELDPEQQDGEGHDLSEDTLQLSAPKLMTTDGYLNNDLSSIIRKEECVPTKMGFEPLKPKYRKEGTEETDNKGADKPQEEKLDQLVSSYISYNLSSEKGEKVDKSILEPGQVVQLPNCLQEEEAVPGSQPGKQVQELDEQLHGLYKKKKEPEVRELTPEDLQRLQWMRRELDQYGLPHPPSGMYLEPPANRSRIERLKYLSRWYEVQPESDSRKHEAVTRCGSRMLLIMVITLIAGLVIMAIVVNFVQ